MDNPRISRIPRTSEDWGGLLAIVIAVALLRWWAGFEITVLTTLALVTYYVVKTVDMLRDGAPLRRPREQ